MKIICHAEEILAKRNLPMTWLSHKTGIEYGTLRGIIKNRYKGVKGEYLFKISIALEMTIEEVFEFVEE